jgi:hypothetical protein
MLAHGSIEGTASSTGPQESQLLTLVCRRSPNVYRRLHTAGLESGIVHTSGHWIQGCASSPLPWGSQLLARPGVDHLIELQPGPHGSQLPTGSALIDLPTFAAAGPWIHRGDCIESRPGVDHSIELQPARRGSQLQTVSESITRWDSNQVPMDPGLCIMPVRESSVVHTAGHGIHGCAYFRPWDPRLCIESPPVGIAAAGPVGVDHSRELHRVPARR